MARRTAEKRDYTVFAVHGKYASDSIFHDYPTLVEKVVEVRAPNKFAAAVMGKQKHKKPDRSVSHYVASLNLKRPEEI